MTSVTEFTLILVGKTGCGKSKTGNLIIGTSVFHASDSNESVTSECQVEQGEICGSKVTVVDTPGLMDTSVNSDAAKEKTCKEMIEAISRCPNSGKRAICLVMKYGERFTEENNESLYILTSVFGDDFLAKSCVIIFTHGDSFDEEYQEAITFKNWCLVQDGKTGELIKLCQYRCVLFRNLTENDDVKRIQITELFENVKNLDESYSNEKFTQAKKRHKRLILEGNLTAICKNLNEKIQSVQKEIDDVTLNEKGAAYVESLKVKGAHILYEIKQMDDGVLYQEGEVSLLHDQISRTENIIRQANERIHFAKLYEIRCKMINEIDTLHSNIIQARKCVSEEKPLKALTYKHEIENLIIGWREEVKCFFRSDLVCQELCDETGNTMFFREPALDTFGDVNPKFKLMKEELLIFEKDILLGEKEGLEQNIYSKITVLEQRLSTIPCTETRTKTATKIMEEIDGLINSIKDDAKKKILLEEFQRLKGMAEKKIEMCKRNSRAQIIETGFAVAAGLLTGAGIVASVSKNIAATAFTKVAPSAAKTLLNFGKGVVSLIRNR